MVLFPSKRWIVAVTAVLLHTFHIIYGWVPAVGNRNYAVFRKDKPLHNPACPRRGRAIFQGRSTDILEESKQQGRLIDVSLPKPMGLILEEDSSVGGVTTIVDILVDGNTAETCRKSGTFLDLCIGDKVVAIEGVSCLHCTLDQVMDTIADSPNPVHLTLQRPVGAVAVRFVQSGVAIAALPGTPVCNLAVDTHTPISYSCRNGACGTCEQTVVDASPKDVAAKSGVPQYLRPCTGRVPKRIESITLTPSGRFAV